ncbi:MAG TPA: glycoside hydrolase family 3 C-terminal domain-containing protein [Balneolaceae bacterium]|nr:glycoside hydrolase family 3 C-terminal domain-containing protein [Balneolaceae bacterium]
MTFNFNSRKGIFSLFSIITYVLLTTVFIPKTYAQDEGSGSSKPIYLDTKYSFRERAADLVSRMTLAEEVKQLHTNNAPAIPRLGVHQYIYWSEGQHGINAMFGNMHNGKKKQEHAYGSPHATSFPVNFSSAMSWDPELIYKETQAISDEARGFLDKSLFGTGQNNLGESKDDYGNLTYWAPTVNIDRDPRWGRTDEAFGEDPYLASQMAGAFVNGYQDQTMDGQSKTSYLKVATTAKHFALNNIENNRRGISSDATDEAIRDYYTATFRHLIEKAHVAGLMSAYNAINGTPAVASTYTVDELAQRTYGFNGYITSDCGAVGTTYKNFPSGHNWAAPGWSTDMQGDSATWTNKETSEKIPGAAGGQAYAVRAGTELNCTGDEYTLSNIKDAIEAGILSKGVIDRALTDVFTIRMRTGEFDPPEQVPYTSISKDVIESPAHHKLAEQVAENSLVLLKNDPVQSTQKPLLPVDASKLNKVVIVGNLANKVTLGGYSGDPTLKIDAVQGITSTVKKANSNASVIFDDTGTSTTANNPANLDAKTKSDIKSADLVVVFVGTDMAISHEGHDRASLAMPGNYKSLIYQVAQLGNPNMVMTIQSVGPVKINNVQPYFPAIVYSSYNGESQGTALASVLFGKKNPSGHLDFTWYQDDTQLPSKSNYHLTPSKTRGLGRTYMYFTGKVANFAGAKSIGGATYPFGYGLSYSQFKISNVDASTNQISPDGNVDISFDVTNTGSTTGATVAQLYVTSPKVKGKEMPLERLKGFQKTNELKPEETQHVTLKVKGSNLSFWNEDEMKRVVYNGTYQFKVGYNSRDFADSAAVNIQGNLTPKVTHVTVQPEAIVYHVGDTIDLNSKNQWIKSDIDPAREQPHEMADHIVEAVYNNSSFVDLSDKDVSYKSSDNSVAKVGEDGVVKATGKGVATITATVDGESGSAVIVVQ